MVRVEEAREKAVAAIERAAKAKAQAEHARARTAALEALRLRFDAACAAVAEVGEMVVEEAIGQSQRRF